MVGIVECTRFCKCRPSYRVARPESSLFFTRRLCYRLGMKIDQYSRFTDDWILGRLFAPTLGRAARFALLAVALAAGAAFEFLIP